MCSNKVSIIGRIETGFMLDHDCYHEKFYQFLLSVKRDSGTDDVLPVIVSEKLLDVTKDKIGEYVHIDGEFRSFNNHDDKGKIHLFLYVFPLQIDFLTDPEEVAANSIFLEGYICKKPTYRKTPLGREITDMLIAVNRPSGKSDYLPCIAWGRNAKYAERQLPGSYVSITGRIQSRYYEKEGCPSIAYEVSVITLDLVENLEAGMA